MSKAKKRGPRHSWAKLLCAVLLLTAPLSNPVLGSSVNLPPRTIDLPKRVPGQSAEQYFDLLVNEYYRESFQFEPSWATSSGFHNHDSELENYSAGTYAAKANVLRAFLSSFTDIEPSGLSPIFRHDREILIGQIKASLLAQEELKSWKKNPDQYSSGITSSIFGLVKRNFAPLGVRLNDVIEREKQIPEALRNAKLNLDPHLVPQVYAEVALEQVAGGIGFLRDDVPTAFTEVKDPLLQSELKSSSAEAVAAFKDYQSFLKNMVDKKACTGTFALGEDLYKQKLADEELVDESIDSLLARGAIELKRLQDEFSALSNKIDASKTPQQNFEEISKDHPKPDHLLADIHNLLERLRTFCVEKKIVTIPFEDRPIVEESPPFMRALTFASLDEPGLFEKKAAETYYHVTLPESNWSPTRTEEHMRFFSYPDLLNTSIHEAYPGHFVEFLWDKKAAPTKVRKLSGCGSNAEGWAHYSEQMMLDEGFGDGDKKLKMVQLHDALLRACRYIVGLKMHTRGMTVDEGIKFFMTEGFQEQANAERETKRGTMDPTYLVYTLGKLQILALREDYKKLKGSEFTLQDFHDKFLAVGCVPIKIVRAELLNNSAN